MGFLGFGKKKGFLDLTDKYNKQQEKIAQQDEDPQNDFSFLGNLASGSTAEPEDYVDVSGAEEKRKKLAKRFMDMTAKLEDLSNQIYHLQQRIEVLEQKLRVGGNEEFR